MKFLQLDTNHSVLREKLEMEGHVLEDDFSSEYSVIKEKLKVFEGIIIRSRVPLDKELLEDNPHLKCIGRVGAGLENIDTGTAEALGIEVFNAPEGNCDAVAEHVLALLLALANRLITSSEEVKKGIWEREGNRGMELKGKTFGIIGYGHMGKAVAKRLQGFGCKVIFHDIVPNLSDENAKEVSLEELQKTADVVSLHIPLTEQTHYYIDELFISKMAKPFYLINTSRGKNASLKAIAQGIRDGKILGAALDVLEVEKSSFENVDTANEPLGFLLNSEKCLITPHIAGWTHESKYKLAEVLADKILTRFPKA